MTPTSTSAPARLAATVLLAATLLAPFGAAQHVAEGALPTAPSVDAVLLEIAARFDPDFPGDRAAHADPAEPCLTPLLGRLRHVAPLLTPAERSAAAALDPSVAAVLQAAAPGVAESTSSLPDYPALTETWQGKDCVVHYTLTGQHAAPDMAFVKAVAKNVDKAAKTFGKDYPRPFFERDRDDVDTLHVYIVDSTTVEGFDDAVLGFVNPTEEVEGAGNEKALTTWMAIDRTLKSHAEQTGANWKKSLKATVFHEYYHCVQLAHNAFMSSWGLEGQAMWAEVRYAKFEDDLKAFLERSDSLVKEPTTPIWDDGVRKYSTAPFWAYVEQRLGKDALVRFWEESSASQDPILVLELLLLDEFVSFDDFWLAFAGRLVAGDLQGFAKDTLPAVAVQATVTDFGWSLMGSLKKTAILAYRLVAPSDKKTDLLFARVVDGDGSGDGRPAGVLVHDGDKRLTLGTGSWESVDKYKQGEQAVLVVTDGDYEFPDETGFPFTAEAFPPYFDVHDVDFGDPVPAGQQATVTFRYDLLCVPAGATFDVAIYRRIKGKKLDLQTQTTHAWPTGSNQEAEVTFTVPTFPPQKKIKVQLNVKVPPDSYGGEHLVSKHKGKIKVLDP